MTINMKELTHLTETDDYLDAILMRAKVPLEPVSFKVNWDDAPLHHKVYRNVARRSLPTPLTAFPDTPFHELVEGMHRNPTLQGATEELLTDLLVAYGHLDRRVEMNWNEDTRRKLQPNQALWGRPTASGGGMYPLEIYHLAGEGSRWHVGTSHYDSVTHSLDVLDNADRTGTVAAATGRASASFLVVTCRFWMNAFKYNSFCYHVVTQDLGCLLASWRVVAAAHGWTLEPIMHFDNNAVSRQLGIDGRHEAPFLVLCLEPSGATPPPPARGEGPLGDELGHCVFEASRRTWTFPRVDKIHAACFQTDQERPVISGIELRRCPPGPRIPLPAARTSHPTEATLRKRRSAFGAISRSTGVSLEQLAVGLRCVSQMALEPTDYAPQGRERWIGQWIIVQGVDGLDDGTYCYLDETDELVRTGTGQLKDLQRFYPLKNYSLGEVSVVHVMTTRLKPIREQAGRRALRVANLEVGQAGQAMYLAAAATGFAAGAVLGLDNLEIDQFLGIDDTDEQSLLCHLLGAWRPGQSNFTIPFHISEATT